MDNTNAETQQAKQNNEVKTDWNYYIKLFRYSRDYYKTTTYLNTDNS